MTDHITRAGSAEDTTGASAGLEAGAAGSAAPGAAENSGAGRGDPPRPGLLAQLQSIGRELPGLLGDRIDLLTLELQRAGRALAQIVALLVAASILAVTAWLALWAGITVGLVELGLHWSLALLLVLLLNGVVAALALGRLRTLLPLLRLPATRRHLVPGQGRARPDAADGPSRAQAQSTAATVAGQGG